MNSFPLIGDCDTRILILGTMPGAKSLEARQYYANPRNQVWRLLAEVFGEIWENSFDYPQRIGWLKAHQVGLWDVYAACDRVGSLDTAIRNAEPNKFDSLLLQCPRLQCICFNGRKAGSVESQFKNPGVPTMVLLSSSPALAKSFEEKLKDWKLKLAPHCISTTDRPLDQAKSHR